MTGPVRNRPRATRIRRGPAGTGRRPYEPVLRRRDWTFPPPALRHRELVSAVPDEPVAGRPPLLFLHGAAMGAWAWERWLPQAADAGWAAHAVSLRGHAGSDAPTPLTRTPLRYYEHDVLQAITELPAPPVLIGHSMGGLVVQHVLERYRAAPAGVLIGPVPPAHGLEVLGSLVRHDPAALASALVGRPPQPRAELLVGRHTDHATAQGWADRMGQESSLAATQAIAPRRPRDIRAPLLVIGGGDDRVVPPHALTRTARTYGVRAHLFRGLGHLMMLEEAGDGALRFVLRWLEDTLRATGELTRPARSS